MKRVREEIVNLLELDGNQEKELSRLLGETLTIKLDEESLDIGSGESQAYNIMTVEMAKSIMSGSSIKPSNFKFKIDTFIYGLPLILSDVSSLTVIPVLYSIFNNMKVLVGEKECFILYSLHNHGAREISVADAFSLLEKDWEVFPEYRLEWEEFSHCLKKLDSKKIIKFRDEKISLIEEIVIKYK